MWIKKNRIIMDSVVSVLILIVTTLVTACMEPFAMGNFATMPYILAVVIISRVTNGYLYGIVASLVGVIGVNYFFTHPFMAINFMNPGYPITFFCMLLTAFITSTMTTRVKKHAEQAQLREKRTERLLSIGQSLLVINGQDRIVRMALHSFGEISGCKTAYYTQDESGALSGITRVHTGYGVRIPDSDESRHIQRALTEKKKVRGEGLYLPLCFQNETLGVVALYPTEEGVWPEGEALEFIELGLTQVAMALKRQRLSDAQQTLSAEAEREKTRSELLRSVSHDLRTPLTSMIGASSLLLEKEDQLEPETKRRLIKDVKLEAEWLIRMVENLLFITRLGEGGTQLNRTEEAVEEVVEEAVARVRNRFEHMRLRVSVPVEYVCVPMDPMLIEQVIINLMENAIHHAGNDANIELKVTAHPDDVLFEVTDDGVGLSGETLSGILTDQERALLPGKTVNSGMGIAICKAIVRAHGGTFAAENNKSGGARFAFTLPMGGQNERE